MTWALLLIVVGLVLDGIRPRTRAELAARRSKVAAGPPPCPACAPRLRASARVSSMGRTVRFGARTCPKCQRSVPLLGALVVSGRALTG